MGRDRDMYLDFGTPGRRPGRRGPGIGTICAVLLVVLLAIALGVFAYQLSKENIGDLPGVPTTTPVPGSPTPPPTPTPTPTPTSTPTPTPTSTPTPLPTSPETGLPCTPTPPPTVWDPDYLDGFVDTREDVTVRGAHGGLDLNEEDILAEMLRLAEESELNAVVIDVKADTGRVTYQMDCEAIKKSGTWTPNYKDMPGLLAELKARGVYCIARVVCFKDNVIDNVYPEWMIHNKDGSMYRDNEKVTWMNPYNRDTWVYLVDIAEQAVLDGFDEICFDYIRFSTNGIIASGTTWEDFVLKVDLGPEAETTSFEDIITEFTMYACNRLKPLGAYVSASVYGGVIQSKTDAARVGQNLVDMSRWLDYICPMIYPSHYNKNYAYLENAWRMPYELVTIEVKAAMKKLATLDEEDRAVLRPWFQGFSYSAEEVREQITALYENGGSEWLLWHSGATYVDGAFRTPEEAAAEWDQIEANRLLSLTPAPTEAVTPAGQ